MASATDPQSKTHLGNGAAAGQVEPTSPLTTLRLFCAHDQAVEIRVLKVPGRGEAVCRTFTDLAAAARFAEEMDRLGAAGCYFTLNPVRPGLAGSRAGCKKGDITERRWFLCDVDPTREAGTSSDEAELAAAWEVACRVRAVLEPFGVKNLVIACSGNGWHVLVPILLPNDDNAQNLLKELLRHLEVMCGNPRAHVDKACHDAPRICKLYGTTARKGEPTPERPHRLAFVVEGVPWDHDVAVANAAALERLGQSCRRGEELRRGESRGGAQGYVRAALDGEGQAILAHPKGDGLNTQLARSAFKVGQLLHADGLTVEQARDELYRFARQAGADDPGKDLSTIERQLKAGMAKPRDVPNGQPGPRPDPGPAVPEPPDWPKPPGPDAFYGLAGEVVRAIEPASEADPVAVLAQFLVAFGNVIGRTGHFKVEADCHYGNESIVLVGKTAKARKGVSWGHVERLFREVAGTWATEQVQTGVSSAEGLIWTVRDPIYRREKNKDGEYEEVEVDPGVDDKRLFLFEPEFTNVLKQTERLGNTLSAILRLAWDGRDLRTLVKHNPAKATGTHVSLVGHITADELRRYLTATEMANGFGNRHMFFCVRRSKELPEGGGVDERAWNEMRDVLEQALEFAKSAGKVNRDEEARALWRSVYGKLSEGKPGLAGALLARGEAHVMRLAMLYALLDAQNVIRAPHLRAALALWDYAERSVRHVFGDCLGDDVADEILRLLRDSPAGVTRTDMMQYFGRNQSSARIARALSVLLGHQLARRQRQESGAAGRPSERWFATVQGDGCSDN
jgi:hypothetical protein